MKMYKALVPALGALAFTGASLHAETISVTIENTMGADSFFFTPVWFAAHNGGFDSFDVGSLASNFPGITSLAENGNTSPLSNAFASSAAGIAGGVDGTLAAVAFAGDAPVYSPGESATFSIDVGNSSVNRFFSFASMVVPSNDLFFGNDDATAYELFDLVGNFNGDIVINIYGRDVYDNGTEFNSATNDAAFSVNDGQSISEAGIIRSFFSESSDVDYLDSFLQSGTANGATIGSTFGADDIIATITISQVPAPSGALALLGGGLMMTRRRRSN